MISFPEVTHRMETHQKDRSACATTQAFLSFEILPFDRVRSEFQRRHPIRVGGLSTPTFELVTGVDQRFHSSSYWLL